MLKSSLETKNPNLDHIYFTCLILFHLVRLVISCTHINVIVDKRLILKRHLLPHPYNLGFGLLVTQR